MAPALSSASLCDSSLTVKRLIISGFGTSDESAMAESERLEKLIASSSPIAAECTYLGPFRMEGKERTGDAIRKYRDDELIIFPILVQKGGLYSKLLSYGYPTGMPLLGSNEDAEDIAGILSATLERKENHRYIFISHGDENGDTDEFRALKKALREDILVTALKGNDNYTTMEIPKEKNITVLPFLLFSGHHAKKDIKEKVLPELSHGGKCISYMDKGLLSLSDGFSAIFLKHLSKLLSR